MRKLALLVLVACGRSQTVADQELGGLVVAQKAPDDKIDLDRAAKDPDELTRALERPFHAALTALGPHTLTIASQTQTDLGGAKVEDLSDTVTLETGSDGTWHGVYTNSADYGRESVFVSASGGKQLYLRPRYQRWHGRAPETPEEPDQLRDAYAEAVGATWELLAPAVELTDEGTANINGRGGRKITVKQAPQPRPNPAETLSQRKWREKRTITSVAGTIILDTDTGVPLHVELTGAIGFVRDGKPFTMKLAVTADAKPGAVAIAAPAQTDVVATPERAREVDDRDFLLQGIAPPLRKNADGTAVAPATNKPAEPGKQEPKK